MTTQTLPAINADDREAIKVCILANQQDEDNGHSPQEMAERIVKAFAWLDSLPAREEADAHAVIQRASQH